VQKLKQFFILLNFGVETAEIVATNRKDILQSLNMMMMKKRRGGGGG
jgi:hypothetical protein